MALTPDTPRTRRVVLRSLIGRIAALLVVFTVAVYVGIYVRTQDLAMQAVEEQARTYTALIIKARAWNAGYGGVYVPKVAGVKENPYLRDLGVEPDISAGSATLTMRNPAMMTGEIAELLAADTGVRFHLTSLDPVNPDNAPDGWEASHLDDFDEGISEVGEFLDGTDDGDVYRYMAPLYVEESCLGCHSRQDYEVGQVRGAISVTIPTGQVTSDLRLNQIGFAAIGVVTLVGILSIVYVMSSRVVDRLEEAERQLEHLAVTDPLTELWNRRYMMRRLREEFERSRRQGHDLGLIMIDLDHFKDVNDRFGHAAGDLVLRAAAERMLGAVRDYDTLGRFGGEEFLVIVPETAPEDVRKLAERVRTAISMVPVTGPGEEITVTASCGVAMLAQGDLTVDATLARADGALYAAKETGRDRVVLGETPESRSLL